MQVIVSNEGVIRFIYDDVLAAVLAPAGRITTRRASHVEPEGTKWVADLLPVNGPKLGPFDTRVEALKAEADWLDANRIPIPNP
jgi:hypothetical protein